MSEPLFPLFASSAKKTQDVDDSQVDTLATSDVAFLSNPLGITAPELASALRDTITRPLEGKRGRRKRKAFIGRGTTHSGQSDDPETQASSFLRTLESDLGLAPTTETGARDSEMGGTDSESSSDLSYDDEEDGAKGKHTNKAAVTGGSGHKGSSTKPQTPVVPPPRRTASVAPLRWWLTQDSPVLYRLDVKGDRDNLLYESLHKTTKPSYTMASKYGPGVRARKDGYGDAVRFGKGLRRYLARKFTLRERDQHYQRIPLSRRLRTGSQGTGKRWGTMARTGSEESRDYMSLDIADDEPNPIIREKKKKERAQTGLSPMELRAKRRTELNKAIIDKPHVLQVWLDFLAFQSEGYENQHRLPASIAEHRLSIYSRALKYHPGNAQLLLGYLRDGAAIWPPDTCTREWTSVLADHANQPALWIEYYNYRLSDFASCSLPKLRNIIQLANSCLDRYKMSSTCDPKSGLSSCDVLDYELAQISLTIRAVKIEHDAGYSERAISVMQALFAYNCLGPAFESLPSAVTDRQAIFGEFWDSETPRVGEDGECSWDAWYANRSTGQYDPSSQQRDNAGFAKTLSSLKRTMPKGDKNSYASTVYGQQLEAGKIKPQSNPDLVRCTDAAELLQADGSRIFQDWAQTEVHRDSAAWNPVHANDPGIDLDLDEDRHCSWADIQPYMFDITHPQCKVVLAALFLRFLGVDIAGGTGGYGVLGLSSNWQSDSYFLSSSPTLSDLYQYSVSRSPGTSGNSLLDVLQYLEYPDLAQRSLMTDDKVSFVVRVFDICHRLWPANPDILVARFRFEQDVCTVKSARKAGRELLRYNPECVPLWTEYCLFEFRQGGIVTSDPIIAKTKQAMATGTNTSAFRSLLTLYTASVIVQEPELLNNSSWKERQTLFLLQTAHANVTAVNSASILRGQTMMKGWLTNITSSALPDDPGAVSTCVQELVDVSLTNILFKVALGSVNEAQDFYRTAVNYLKQQTRIMLSQIKGKRVVLQPTSVLIVQGHWERLTVTYVSLLQAISQARLGSLRDYKAALVDALDTFPSNRTLVALFITLEARSRTSVRVRRFFEQQVARLDGDGIAGQLTGTSRSPWLWIFALASELAIARELASQGSDDSFHSRLRRLMPRLRSLMGRIVNTQQGASNVTLWRLWIHLEIQMGQPDRAKRLHFRALRACPASKMLWLDSIRIFGGEQVPESARMDPTELNTVIETMTTRTKLRVRTSMEEVILVHYPHMLEHI